MDKKYTIKDIAELAGVSKGTVDRVLHKRGKVSSKSLELVEKVLEEIDYQPNPIARNLKNNKVYKICVLLPDPEDDPYWISTVQGIDSAAKEYRAFGVLVNKYYYNFNQISFLSKSQEALNTCPDVLLMAPLFQKEASKIFKQCQESKVLVALFNNVIEEFNTQSFIGQDLCQTGRVAAGLIDKLVDNTSTIAILHINEERHMKLKENGFKAYFEDKDHYPNFKTYSLKTSNFKAFKEASIKLVKNTKDISAVFVTNSKSYIFLKAINEVKHDLVVIGYDLLPENISYLKNGQIDFLIHQKPKRQAYLGVVYLAEYFLFGKSIPKKNLLPIDIITPENVIYYMN